jgi:hypothetical protein
MGLDAPAVVHDPDERYWATAGLEARTVVLDDEAGGVRGHDGTHPGDELGLALVVGGTV